jgi:hypothetical protein
MIENERILTKKVEEPFYLFPWNAQTKLNYETAA